MYQPKRVADLAVAPTEAPAFAGPRRVQRRRAEVVAARMAPTAVSLALLTTTGAFALSQRATQAEPTTTTDALTVREDSVSRSAARAYAAEPTPAKPTHTQAAVAGAWHASLGTVAGEKFAQAATPILTKAAPDAAPLTQLAPGQKVQVTQVVTAGFQQVLTDGKVGYVPADSLTDRAPAAPADAAPETGKVAASASAEAGSGKLFWPTAGTIGSPWGMRFHPILHYTRLHAGVDIGGATGQPIYAAADGVVTKAETGYNSGSGTNVRIDHGKIGGKELETAYLHMQKFTVKVGQKVTKGQVIGYVGSTGLSTAPHLHFSVYVNGVNSNPAAWISR